MGDVVITSGLGGSYFRGVALGTVVNVINAAGTSDRTIVVEPFSSADPLEELTVVLRIGSEGDFRARAMLRLPIAVPPKAVRRHA